MVNVELRGFDQFGRRLSRYPQQQQAEVQQTMTAGLLLIEATQRRLAPQDTRRLLGSITSEIQTTNRSIIGRVGPTVRYGYWAEYGRRPGKRPPIAAIAGWARRHGISPFVVARAIGRRGTRRYRGDPRSPPYVAPSLTQNLPALQRMFARIGLRLTSYLSGRAV